jgi:hypothetical protein
VAAPTCPATLAEPFDPRMVIGGLWKQGSEDPVLFPIDQPPPLGEVRRCRVGVARQRSLGVIALRAGEAKVVESVPPTQGEWDHMIDRAGPLARDELTPAYQHWSPSRAISRSSAITRRSPPRNPRGMGEA